MITKTDWDNALDAWVEEERERLGGPPSPDEVVGYLSGELPSAEAARVRALLVYYPELTPLLGIRTEKPRRAWGPAALRLYAVAATVIIAILGLNALDDAEPVVPSSHHEFHSGRTRSATGGLTYDVPAGQQRYLITAVPDEPPAERAYSLEIARGSQILWTAREVQPLDGTFVVDIPGDFLTPGTYALNVRADGELVERYPFRVVTLAR